MARGMQINRYPPQYTDLAEEIDNMVQQHDEAVVVTMRSKEAAIGFRLDFYAYRTAARKEGSIVLYPGIDRVEAHIEDCRVVFINKEKTEAAHAIEQALAERRAMREAK